MCEHVCFWCLGVLRIARQVRCAYLWDVSCLRVCVCVPPLPTPNHHLHRSTSPSTSLSPKRPPVYHNCLKYHQNFIYHHHHSSPTAPTTGALRDVANSMGSMLEQEYLRPRETIIRYRQASLVDVSPFVTSMCGGIHHWQRMTGRLGRCDSMLNLAKRMTGYLFISLLSCSLKDVENSLQTTRVN